MAATSLSGTCISSACRIISGRPLSAISRTSAPADSSRSVSRGLGGSPCSWMRNALRGCTPSAFTTSSAPSACCVAALMLYPPASRCVPSVGGSASAASRRCRSRIKALPRSTGYQHTSPSTGASVGCATSSVEERSVTSTTRSTPAMARATPMAVVTASCHSGTASASRGTSVASP